MRSADVGSDHHLVLAKVQIKLATRKKDKNDRVRCNVGKLKNEATKTQFQLELANRFDALYNGSDTEEGDEDSVDKEWKNIKDMFLSTCDEILGKPETGRKK